MIKLLSQSETGEAALFLSSFKEEHVQRKPEDLPYSEDAQKRANNLNRAPVSSRFKLEKSFVPVYVRPAAEVRLGISRPPQAFAFFCWFPQIAFRRNSTISFMKAVDFRWSARLPTAAPLRSRTRERGETALFRKCSTPPLMHFNKCIQAEEI